MTISTLTPEILEKLAEKFEYNSGHHLIGTPVLTAEDYQAGWGINLGEEGEGWGQGAAGLYNDDFKPICWEARDFSNN